MGIVLAIIALLMALSASAVIRYIDTQRKSNTQALLRTLAGQLDGQMRLVTERAMLEPIGLNGPNASTIKSTILTMAGGNPERARVIWVKLRLKQAFPNDFTEALDPGGSVFAPSVFPPLPTFLNYLTAAGVSYNAGTGTLTGGLGQPTESSVCLLLALQQGQSGMGLSAEDIGSSFIRDVPASTGRVRLIVDGWNNPVIFCRWPYNSDVLNPVASTPLTPPHAQPGLHDPGDPRGLLTDATWLASTAPSGPGPFANMLGYTPPGRNGTAPQSFNLTPVIVSSGGDGKMGLDPSSGLATSPAGNSDLYDNIYSIQMLMQ
jgi:type II secretory pathway pseudopilin PulG